MPRKPEVEKLETTDADHTVDRCQRALAAGIGNNAVYTAYWTKQLAFAEARAAREVVKRKETFG